MEIWSNALYQVVLYCELSIWRVHWFLNIILNNTSPDPPLVINLIMCKLCEKCKGMILMFVGNMLHERFHLAVIISWKPSLVDVAHQYRWLRTPVTQSAIFSQPSSLPSGSIFFPMDGAMCQMSNKWAQPGWLSRIHVAMPLWQSDMKSTTARPTDWRYENARLAPSSTIGELPPVSFACNKFTNK